MVNAVFCLTVLLVKCLVFSEALKLPSYVSPCSRSDPKFKECVIENSKVVEASNVKGDPKYHFPSLDPLVIPEVSVDDRGAPVGLSIAFKDMKLYGMTAMKLDDFNIDVDEKTMFLKISVPRVEALTQYSVSGKVLILPVTGKGDANITLDNLDISFPINIDFTTRPNGKVHMVLKDLKVDFTVSNAVLRFENLFNGNKALGEQVNVLINENWKVLVKDIGTPIAGAIVQSILQGFEYVVEKIPFNEIFLD